MNMVLTAGVPPVASPKLLSPGPGTLVSPPPPPTAPRLLAHQIAHQTLLARQHENLLLSLRPPMLPVLPGYPPPMARQTMPLQSIHQSQLLPTKRTYDRAFTQAQQDQTAAKRQYVAQQQITPMSLPVFSYGGSTPIFTYANSAQMLQYANALPAGFPTALPAGYGALSAAGVPPGLSAFPAGALSMFPTYPYYPGV